MASVWQQDSRKNKQHGFIKKFGNLYGNYDLYFSLLLCLYAISIWMTACEPLFDVFVF